MITTAQDMAKDVFYNDLSATLATMFDGERSQIANMANMSSVLFHEMAQTNWAGFYLLDGDELVLGPFQGKPACIRIGMGRGVCGTAAFERRSIVVPDVHAFPGHIACDPDSGSEIVIPVLAGSNLLGVLDIDSPVVDRFDADDQTGLESLVALLVKSLDV